MKLKDSGMKLTIGIGDTSSIDKECGIYRRGIKNPNYPGFLYLMEDPSDNVTPNAKALGRINETRNKAKVIPYFIKFNKLLPRLCY